MGNGQRGSESTTARFAQAAAVLSALTTALVAYNTYTVSQFESELKQIESDRELNFRIYASISEALESNDSRQIQAVRTIVISMSPEDLRDGFLQALDNGLGSIFDEEQVDVAAPRVRTASQPVAGSGPVSWGEWDFDIFWCSVSGSTAQKQAENLRDALIDDGAQGRVRVRILPESRRQQVSESAWGYEVRGETGEEAIAEKLTDLGRRVVSPEFSFIPIEQEERTQWYVSAFICPNVSGA